MNPEVPMKRTLSVTLMVFLLVISCGGSEEQTSTSLVPVDYMDLPCSLDSLAPLERAKVSLALGEFEPLALLLSVNEPVSGVRVQLSGLPEGVSAKLYRVTEHKRNIRSGEAVMPYFLEETESLELPAGSRQALYLVFEAAPDATPGETELKVSLAGAELSVDLEVYPFQLREDPDYFFGAFCGGRDVDITPQHMADLKARGFDALQFFWGSVSVALSNDKGRLVVDFSRTDRWMEDFKAAGLRGPVVWSMGNDYRSHMENMLATTVRPSESQAPGTRRQDHRFRRYCQPAAQRAGERADDRDPRARPRESLARDSVHHL